MAAVASGRSIAQWLTPSVAPPPGRTMTRTPRKPISTADQRRTPTFSPRSGTEKTVRRSGCAKAITVAVASGNSAMPKK